jgi:hypothetical protein
MFGNAPASPAPKRNRTMVRSASPPNVTPATCHPTSPVRAVKNDHQRTTRIKTRRGPNRSPHHPVGISNNPYATAKAVNAHFRSATLVRPRSLTIDGAAVPKQIRSR